MLAASGTYWQGECACEGRVRQQIDAAGLERLQLARPCTFMATSQATPDVQAPPPARACLQQLPGAELRDGGPSRHRTAVVGDVTLGGEPSELWGRFGSLIELSPRSIGMRNSGAWG